MLVVPWVLLYDSKGRKPLTKLEITFNTGDSDIRNLRTNANYGPPLQRIDELKSFEVEYAWQPVEPEDVSLGLSVMFAVTLLGIVIIGTVVLSDKDDVVRPSRPTRVESRREVKTRKTVLGVNRTQ